MADCWCIGDMECAACAPPALFVRTLGDGWYRARLYRPNQPVEEARFRATPVNAKDIAKNLLWRKDEELAA